MGAPTHDHGFVLHHHSNDNTCLFCLFCSFCFDIPSWHCAHGPKTLRMMMMLMLKPQGRKKIEWWWEMMRKNVHLPTAAISFIQDLSCYGLSVSLDTFYIYMHSVFLCCDLFSVEFIFLCFAINCSHRNKRFSPSKLVGTAV